VIDGDIPLKSPMKAFYDIIARHKHKKTKIRETEKVEEQKNMDTTVATEVHHLIEKTAKKYGIKKKSDEFKELHDQADSLFEQMPDLDGKPPEQFVDALFNIVVGDLPDKKPRKPKNPMLSTSSLKQHYRRSRPNWRGLHRKVLSEISIWLFKGRQQRELSTWNMVDTMWVEKLPEPKELGILGMRTGKLLTQIEKPMI